AGRGEHVEVVALVRMYFLPLEGAIDGLQPVAQERGTLERERRRRRLHLLLGIARERLVAALEKEHAPVDRRAVLILRRVTDARRGAALQVVEQARPAAGQCARRQGATLAVVAGDDRELAGPVREELL